VIYNLLCEHWRWKKNPAKLILYIVGPIGGQKFDKRQATSTVCFALCINWAESYNCNVKSKEPITNLGS
jgi:hypothetical protein